MTPNLRTGAATAPVAADGEPRPVHGTPRFVIVTGLSGAGKSQTMKCFEDLGFFCIDNLPPSLVVKFAELVEQSGGRIQRVALMLDVRSECIFGDAREALAALGAAEIPYDVLFLESSDEALIRRFSETRRKHPLDRGGPLIEAISAERAQLAPFKERADYVWDTSSMTLSQLKERVVQTFGGEIGTPQLHASIVAFGFKYGIPPDADLIFDCRFLPNPNYVPELQPLTGDDPHVAAYLDATPLSAEFLVELYRFVDFLLPHVIEEGKSRLTIGIGCTGGRHRSVYVARRLAEHLQARNARIAVTVHPRDTQR